MLSLISIALASILSRGHFSMHGLKSATDADITPLSISNSPARYSIFRSALVSILLSVSFIAIVPVQAQITLNEQQGSLIEFPAQDLFRNEHIRDMATTDDGLIWVLGKRGLYYLVNEGVFAYEGDLPDKSVFLGFLEDPEPGRLSFLTEKSIVQFRGLGSKMEVIDLVKAFDLGGEQLMREADFLPDGRLLFIIGRDDKRDLWTLDLEQGDAELVYPDIGRYWDMYRSGDRWIMTGAGMSLVHISEDKIEAHKIDVSGLDESASSRIDIVKHDGDLVYLRSGAGYIYAHNMLTDSTYTIYDEGVVEDIWQEDNGQVCLLDASEKVLSTRGEVLIDIAAMDAEYSDRPRLKISNGSKAFKLESGIWLSSRQGLVQLRDRASLMQHYIVNDDVGRVTNVIEDERRDRVYLLTSTNGLFIYKAKSGELLKTISKDPKGRKVEGFKWRFMDGRLFIYSLNGLYEFNFDSEELLYLVDPFNVQGVELPDRFNTFEVHHGRNEIFLGTKDNHLIRYRPSDGREKLYSMPSEGNSGQNLIYEIDVLPDGDLLILGELDLYILSMSEDKIIRARNRWKSIPQRGRGIISGIRCVNDSTVLLSSFGNGLRVLDIKQDTVYRPMGNPFSTANITDIFYDGMDYVYACSRQGLISYHIPSNTAGLIGPSQGLATQDLYYRYMYREAPGQMMLGLINGFVRFRSSDIDHSLADKWLIRLAEVNGNSVKLDPEAELSLDFSQTNVLFYPVSPLNEQAAPLGYQARMIGLHEDWRSLAAGEPIRYDGLSPGSYQLEIRSPGSEVKALHLPIKLNEPYYQQAWFILSIIALLGAIVYTIYRFRIGYLRKEAQLKAKYEVELVQLEMQSLRAQMNPHFLFNSLNSIKSFIAQNEPRTATRYLNKFSHLIRAILNNSREAMVSLEQELNALELYIDLEQLRFEHSFDYEISRPKDLNFESIQVPPLILQPYVENAIWHGLLHKDGPRQLEIIFRKEEDILVAMIRDNGIGRHAAMEMKSKTAAKHKSLGMTITSDRIRMAQEESTGLGVEILDLSLPDGNAAGTEVRISIPLNKD